MSRPIHKSEAQANAEALARRSSTYADEHAASWRVAFERPTHEQRRLRDLVRDLRKAYADEVPSRLHVHETDAGGDPAWSPEFMRYLTASDYATDVRDKASDTEVYLTPFRACMASMEQSPDEATRRRATMVYDVIAGRGPVEAAMMAGVPEWCAKDVAEKALNVFWRRLSAVRLDLRAEKVA